MDGIKKEDLQFIVSAQLPWERLEGKNILISGANGFLPAYMVEIILFLNDNLFQKKATVFALVRNHEKALRKFRLYRGREDIKYIVQDVCEPLGLSENIDFVIHAASQASPKYYGVDPVGTLSANTLGTFNLLRLAKEKQAETFLFFSSSEVYGEVSDSQIPIKEDVYGYLDPLSVRSCYAESKRMGENMCVSWFHQYDIPVKIVRPFHTYGPDMLLDDGRVFADFIFDVVNNRDIVMKSDGSAIRAFCYSADAIIAFFAVLLEGKAGEAYNVGNSQAEISVLELANLLVKLFPEKNIKIRMENNISEGYIKSRVSRISPDITKITKLGWMPRYSIEEGLTRTVKSFCNV